MKVAVIQMNTKLGEPLRNEAHARELIESAMASRPDVLVLPEMWPLGFFPRNTAELADRDGQHIRHFLAALAREYRVNIVGGSTANSIGAHIYNTCYVFDRDGHQVAVYHKTHLFNPGREGEVFTPGDRLATFELDGVCCGVAICYDLRFPELFRRLALSGAAIVFLPAVWPTERLIHWQTLTRARAIENQIFLVAANACGGYHHEHTLGGHSAIIDPWGEMLATAGDDEEIIQANMRLIIRDQIKQSMDVFADRRPELY